MKINNSVMNNESINDLKNRNILCVFRAEN